MKPDPQLGSAQKDRLARIEASRGGMMRSSAGTVLAEEIQSETEVVLKPCWEKRTPVGGGTRTLEVFLIFH
jgi:hypothetical protein